MFLCRTAVTGTTSVNLETDPQHQPESTLNACAVRAVVSTTSLPPYASCTVAMPALTCNRCVTAIASKPGPQIRLNSNSLHVSPTACDPLQVPPDLPITPCDQEQRQHNTASLSLCSPTAATPQLHDQSHAKQGAL